jgi:Tol biopolymer transport system component
VATHTDIRISQPEGGVLFGLTFSHDSNYVYYVRRQISLSSNVYRVPSLGGEPQKLAENVFYSGVALSPDDKQMAFVHTGAGGETSVVVIGADGSAERKLATRRPPLFYNGSIAWSPNGQLLAVIVSDTKTNQYGVVVLPVGGGSEAPVPTEGAESHFVAEVTWLPDSSGLVLVAGATPTSTAQLWQLSYPGGELSKITNDLDAYFSLSLTADAHTLAVVQNDLLSNLCVLPRGQTSGSQQITSGRKQEGFAGLTWLSNERLAYTSLASGSPQVWAVDADGSHPKQITQAQDFGAFEDVRACASGRYFLPVTSRPGIWRFDADGNHAKQLTTFDNDFYPSCSPDGKWVVFASQRSGSAPTLWKVPVDGGETEALIDHPPGLPDVSPDGKWIATSDEPEPGKPKLLVIPFQGGSPVKTFNVASATPAGDYRQVLWTRDGRELTYVDTRNGVSNLWSQPVDGGPPRQLTDFKSGQIFRFAWSPDGKRAALACGSQTSDVVLLKDQSK